ncbi:DNA-binding response regulator [Clostridium thermosuccinogenes]|uniref:Stage 0 sporulation protein A homolog n=1 Tax=Clostridium thermosuccinogenes TaxID=84032 RepID=A0A2K2FD41_9CLOT|nr:DNA-binding response regulator [Pseudoclostridium thermosuccinogenes]PNT96701.1 DNA-binding response regulator [Pseudoclostridium thermosuccinogenes]PNT98495.1 DNA-binding response regulator [Pseudoclostridium thermosuccinogenes]
MYNVMIVDDEAVIRKGLQCFINWSALDCRLVCEASNGIEAIECLKNNDIDIVIADIRMPGLDGLELSKYIHDHYPSTKVIILTAFADFSYAQAAIKYYVVDFIVKTNPTEKIPEAIKKAKELIMRQKEKENQLKLLESKLRENTSEIQEKLIKDIINGIVFPPDLIGKKLAQNGIQLENFFIIVFEISDPSADYSENPEAHNRFIMSVKNFLGMAFKDYHYHLFVMSKNILFIIVSFTKGSASFCTQSLLVTCNEVLAMLDSFMKFTISIGISGMHKSPAEIPQAYNEALEASSSNFYNSNNVSVYASSAGESRKSAYVQMHKFNDAIVNHIQSGNLNAALEDINKLFQKYRENKEPIEHIKVSSMLLCSLCFRLPANLNLNADLLNINEADIYKQIQQCKSIQSLLDLIVDVIKSISKLTSENKKQYSLIVREVNNFLHNNYNKNINLQSIADHVHVNSSYLSRLFKKETNMSIIDTLNKIRIEKAKQLLMDPRNKVFEVASEVGFDDPTYFTHVFAKYVGMSPKEYRDRSNGFHL